MKPWLLVLHHLFVFTDPIWEGLLKVAAALWSRNALTFTCCVDSRGSDLCLPALNQSVAAPRRITDIFSPSHFWPNYYTNTPCRLMCLNEYNTYVVVLWICWPEHGRAEEGSKSQHHNKSIQWTMIQFLAISWNLSQYDCTISQLI